jgi:hypothetical protein
LVSLRTGNPNLMLGISVLVKNPRAIESRLHSAALELADPLRVRGATEFFVLKPFVTLFEMTELVLNTTFCYRVNIREILNSVGK